MQAPTHAGSMQCMHCFLTYDVFVASLIELDDVLGVLVQPFRRVVEAAAVAVDVGGMLLASLQATTQALQPMQRVVS